METPKVRARLKRQRPKVQADTRLEGWAARREAGRAQDPPKTRPRGRESRTNGGDSRGPRGFESRWGRQHLPDLNGPAPSALPTADR
jgi:hypothetical protein